jgi:hypothetical protein
LREPLMLKLILIMMITFEWHLNILPLD